MNHIYLSHEAYVLTREQFQSGLNSTTQNPLGALLQTSNIKLFLIISVAVTASYLLAILWSTTKAAGIADRATRRLAVIGPLIVRLALSASFFYAAQGNSFLGPELSLATLTHGPIIRFGLFLLSIMIIFGFLTEFAALAGILLMGYGAFHYGAYLLTYANYFGELLVLLIFGSRFLSIDRWLFGTVSHWRKLEAYRWLEVPIVRVLYGFALMYAAYTIKFTHQSLTVNVYNEYHLGQFFHMSGSMVAAGAGLSELLIGFLILIGFAMRWTILISLVFITLSLMYFHELIWPHLMLYGISFSLLINSADQLTIDRYMIPRARILRKQLIGI